MTPEQRKAYAEIQVQVTDLWKTYPCKIEPKGSEIFPLVLHFQNTKATMEVPELNGNSKTVALTIPGMEPLSQCVYKPSDLQLLIPAVHQLKEIIRATQHLTKFHDPLHFPTQSNFGIELTNYHTKIYLSADYNEPRWIVRRTEPGQPVQARPFPLITDASKLQEQAEAMIEATALLAGIKLQTKSFDPFDL